MFKAIVIDKNSDAYLANLTELDDAQLPEGDVTVRVAFSTLNYKDALAITGRSPVVRRFPMVPGIDLAGTVEASNHPRYKAGDRVLINGWGVGEVHWGGLAQKAKLNGDWLTALGTWNAGFCHIISFLKNIQKCIITFRPGYFLRCA